jgi:DNA-binding response OmpR family regulator
MATLNATFVPVPVEAERPQLSEQRTRTRPTPRDLRSVVLIVEPDDDLRAQLAASLRERGIVVDQASDGIGALHALARRAPDAVLLDMDIAGVTAHRLFDILRLDSTTRAVPVVVLSGRDAQESCPRSATGAPAECFMRKPVGTEPIVRELVQVGALRAYA